MPKCPGTLSAKYVEIEARYKERSQLNYIRRGVLSKTSSIGLYLVVKVKRTFIFKEKYFLSLCVCVYVCVRVCV